MSEYKSNWPEDYQKRFWEAYPRRVAKKSALKALDRIKKSNEIPFEVLIAAVKVYARAMRGKDIQYVAHPATWLNAGRWEDDPTAIAGSSPKPTVADIFAELGNRTSQVVNWMLPQIRRR